MTSIKTKIPELSRVKHGTDGVITKGLKIAVWTGVTSELEKAYADLDERTGELGTQTSLNAQLNTSVTNKDGIIQDLSQRNQAHQITISNHEKTIEDRDAAIVKLQAANEQLQASLEEAKQALKDAGKFCASEQDEKVKKCIADFIKEVTFRTVKFAREEKLRQVTLEVYNGIGPALGINDVTKKDSYVSEEEFLRIYTAKVTKELNGRRQCVQTQLLAAFQSKSDRSVPLPLAVFLMLWMTACCGVLSFGACAVKTPLHAVVHVIRNQPKETLH